MKKCLAMLLLVPVIFIACEKMDPSAEIKEPVSENVDAGGTPLLQGAANPGAVATIVIGEAPFSVEIAESEDERRVGLMHRESIPQNYGMWFIFPQPVQEDFWMKDTLMPLDIIFVGEDMKIVDIIKNAPPESTELLSSKAPYRYVLEVNAGAVDKHNIKIGDAVEKRIGPQ